MKTLTIIIPAWHCEKFIMGCVHSIWAQEKVTGWQIKYVIGVDACPLTSEVLKKYGIPHYYSPVNVGHYVMRNSMIALNKSDVWFYFDADDAMKKSCCKRIIENIDKTGFVMPGKLNTDINLRPKTGRAVVENGGAMAFKDEVIKAVGGFKNYKAAADTDFLRRIEMARYNIHKIVEPLYLRRSHPNALTKRRDTGMGSPYRKRIWAEMCEQRKRGEYKINPVITNLETWPYMAHNKSSMAG